MVEMGEAGEKDGTNTYFHKYINTTANLQVEVGGEYFERSKEPLSSVSSSGDSGISGLRKKKTVITLSKLSTKKGQINIPRRSTQLDLGKMSPKGKNANIDKKDTLLSANTERVSHPNN